MRKLVCSPYGVILIVAGGIIGSGLIGVIIYFATGSSSESCSDATTTVVPTSSDPPITTERPIQIPQNPLFISTLDGKIILMDFDGDVYPTLVEDDVYLITSFEYYTKNQVLFYGTTKPYEPVKIWNAENTYSNLMNYSKQWTKTAMAIDTVSDNLYVLDGLNEKLYMIDIESDYYTVILTDLDDPKDIVLDLEKRLIFILQKSSILMTHMDGKFIRKITEYRTIEAFTIDHSTGIVYYAYDDSIKQVVNNTSTRSIIEVKENIISMAVHGNILFFIDRSKNHTNRNLMACIPIDNECYFLENEDIEENLASKMFEIKSYDCTGYKFENSCEKNNGACEQLCIFNFDNYTCKCTAGWQLNDDLKTCSLVED